MKTKKQGNNWTAYFDPETGRYFAEIMYTSREGREQYDYEITQDIYDRLGAFADEAPRATGFRPHPFAPAVRRVETAKAPVRLLVRRS